jgi:hypothetical protein
VSSKPSAEDKFVEAQRKMWEALREYHSFGYKITHEKWMRAAVEAFADAGCGVDSDTICHYRKVAVTGGYVAETVNHQDCRARLLARVMGEADGR